MQSTKSKVAWLFILHAIGITGHTIHDMLPLFYGGTLGGGHGTGVVPPDAGWKTIAAWATPVLLITLMTLTSARWLRWLVFFFAVITTLPNQFHWYQHIFVTEGGGSANAFILTVVQANLYVLCYMSWKWARET